jgi:DNA-directed RNA polymerase subunit N (RpoN/RPB10)
MTHINILLCLLLIICVISVLSGIWVESFINVVHAQPTKCFSCENELKDNVKYLSGPTKCFSCEKELAKKYGSKYAALAQPSKCFSCEKQLLK